MTTWTMSELAINPVTINRPFSLKKTFPKRLSVYPLIKPPAPIVTM